MIRVEFYNEEEWLEDLERDAAHVTDSVVRVVSVYDRFEDRIKGEHVHVVAGYLCRDQLRRLELCYGAPDAEADGDAETMVGRLRERIRLLALDPRGGEFIDGNGSEG